MIEFLSTVSDLVETPPRLLVPPLTLCRFVD